MLLYIEEKVINHPRTKSIQNIFPKAEIVPINNYKSIFQQKINWPTSQTRIIAQLEGNAVVEAPTWYGHSDHGFFFKTTLNCIFDCQYCYLKWAFKNHFPVHFVNYQDIQDQIATKIDKRQKDNPKKTMRWYASDRSDTQWFDAFLWWNKTFFPFFDNFTNIMVESRTKAYDISSLLTIESPTNFEIAYSLNPQILINKYEKWTAPLATRITNINKLLNHWYKVWIRCMPVLPVPNYQEIYEQFLQYLTTNIDVQKIYSFFVGWLMYTDEDYKKIKQKEPWLDILYRLEKSPDWFRRESKSIRNSIYNLFKKYIPNCQICMDNCS